MFITIPARFGSNICLSKMANDLWRDCANWLTRFGLLRQDHKANWPEATLTDLAYTLRDGVLLCNFINSLDPGCIDMKDVNQKPQFAQVSNIYSFRIIYLIQRYKCFLKKYWKRCLFCCMNCTIGCGCTITEVLLFVLFLILCKHYQQNYHTFLLLPIR